MKSGRGSRRSIRYSMFIGVLAGSVFSASGALADSPTPILIPEDLLSITSGGNYKLSADIDLTDQTPGGISSYIAGSFGGRLDGLKEVSADGTKINWKITGLSVPLFDGIIEDSSPGNIDGLSIIKNIDVITQTDGVTGRGIVANWSNNSVIDNVHVSGKLTNLSGSDEVGGIIGRANIISNSSANVNLTNDTNYTGGLAGTAISITNSTSSGVLTINGVKNFTGGIVGQINSSLNNANSSMAVNSEGDYVGGLVGSGPAEISSSNSSGEIVGRNYVGGLIGQSTNDLRLEENVVSADVSGNLYVGGLVGYVGGVSMYPSAANLTVVDGVASGSISGNSYIGGIVGAVTNDATFENVIVNGNIDSIGNYSGGLAGWIRTQATVNDSKVTGNVEGADFVGGFLGFVGNTNYYRTPDATVTINNSFKSGTTNGSDLSDVYNGAEYVGGLLGEVFGSAQIDATYNLGNVEGNTYVGGLVGSAKGGEIANSYVATGSVTGDSYVGGFIGRSNNVSISNSFSLSDVFVRIYTGGGLFGSTSNSEVNNSLVHAMVSGGTSTDQIGGISGYAEASSFTSVDFRGGISGRDLLGGFFGASGSGVEIRNSTTSGTIQGKDALGGFVGQASGRSGDSLYGLTILDSASVVNLTGTSSIGGILGFAISNTAAGEITVVDSYWNGMIVAVWPEYSGTAVGYAYRANEGTFDSFGNWYPPAFNSHSLEAVFINGAYGVRQVNFTEPLTGSVEMREPTSVLQDYVEEYNPEKTWSICSSANGTLPYLISTYAVNPCFVDPGGDGGDDGPIDTPRRERIEREPRELKAVQILEKIEKSLGFKNETPLPKNAPIAFLETTEKIDITKVKAVEIAPTANVKVSAKAGEALQISLKSESKEPVELWVKSPDGSWLLAGVITFDKDGKAILPPLQFKNAGDYTLVLNKPSADSAKGSAPLNQSGSVLVAVS